jgi:hypothetical protein
VPDTATAQQAVADAVREAQAAQRDFLTLEHAALHEPPASRPSAAQVLAQRQEAEHAARRVEIARDRLEAAKTAARLAALEQVGQDIEAYAATGPAAVVHAALQHAAEAAGAYRAAVAAHDAAVTGLSARAGALADATGRSLPVGRGRAGSAVRYGAVTVLRLGDSARIALDRALAGDMPGALAELVPVRDRAAAKRARYYFRMPDGAVLPVNGSPPRDIVEGAHRMTEDHITSYLEGKPCATRDPGSPS